MKTLIAILLLGACTAGAAVNNNKVELLPADAEIEGTLKIVSKPTRIGTWWRNEDRIRFHVKDLPPGKYKIAVKYSAGGDGGKIVVKVNDEVFKRSFRKTDGWEFPEIKEVETIKHPGGKMEIVLERSRYNKTGKAPIDFYGLTLERE